MATYKYLGLSNVANETLVQPSITETIGLDYFGNTSNVTWKQGGTLQNEQHGFRRHVACKPWLRI